MPRKNKNAKKIYAVSLHQLQREIGLTVRQRVKVGKFITKMFKEV